MLYLFCAGVLVLVGALDDRFDISVKIRAVVQAAIAIVMMVGAKLYLLSRVYHWSGRADRRAFRLCADAVRGMGSDQCFQYGGRY